jgi:hypothetical protein
MGAKSYADNTSEAVVQRNPRAILVIVAKLPRPSRFTGAVVRLDKRCSDAAGVLTY